MPKAVKDLTGDQLRRIFRDYLKGVPKERLIRKYDLSEATFWEIVGMYSKKKHPNDVGNAQDIEGPADLLVSPLDTGATATENPIIARNPKDLAVGREHVVEEYDWNGPEEQLRKKGGEINDLIAKRNADKREEERQEAQAVIAENKENTDAILKELSDISTSEAKDLASEAAEAAKATPSVDEQLRLAREAREARQVADAATEERLNRLRIEHADKSRERDQKLIEGGEKQNEELAKAEAKARDEEQKERAADAEALRKEAEDAERKLADLGSGGREGTGGDQPPPSPADNLAEGGEAGNVPADEVKAIPVANTSPTSQPNPVQPAKVEPDKLKGKDEK